jgi:hypothetical protein
MEASNNKEMRDALEAICGAIIVDGRTAKMSLSLFDIKNIAKSALTSPLRNCDVGTPEEQTRRNEAFCDYNLRKTGCKGCPANVPKSSCKFAWAQMPYEAVQEGGSNGSK